MSASQLQYRITTLNAVSILSLTIGQLSAFALVDNAQFEGQRVIALTPLIFESIEHSYS